MRISVRSNVKKFILAFKGMSTSFEHGFLENTTKKVASLIRDRMILDINEKAIWERKYNLVKSIFLQHRGRGAYDVVVSHPGALAAEEGAKPHWEPKNPIWGNRMHPGSRALWFARDTFADVSIDKFYENIYKQQIDYTTNIFDRI